MPLCLTWLISQRCSVATIAVQALLFHQFIRAQDNPRAPEIPQSQTDANLEGAPEPFTPLQPISERQRQQIELFKLFAAARSLEDQERVKEALALLEQAKTQQADNASILTRLSRLFFASGKIDEAIESGRQALAIEPNDPQNLLLMVGLLLERKSDPAAAEAFLKSILKNPSLVPNSTSALLSQRALGDLYFEILDKPEKAADAYAAVVNGMDDKQAAKLTQSDREKILRGGPGDSYSRFGDSQLRTKRFEMAIKALRRGLAYDPDHALIPQILAKTLLEMDKPEEALSALEGYLAKQPQGRDPYELLGQILERLGRKPELLTRIQNAAKNDPKNLSLQFLLADLLREAGQIAESDALLADLVKNQRDPQVFGPLAGSLIKAGKADEFLRIIDEALVQKGAFPALAPQLEIVAQNPKFAGEVLDLGLKRLEKDSTSLREPTRRVLAFIAARSNNPDAFVQLGRMVLLQNPSAQNYREYIEDLRRAGRYTEAAQAIQELFEKHPTERNALMLGLQSQILFLGGQYEDSLKSARAVVELDPNDRRALFFVAFLLSRVGQNDEAIQQYQQILAKFPNDRDVERQARSGLSVVYVNLDQLDKGEQELEMLLTQSPDEPGVNNDLGYLYADQGKNLEKAESMIRKALEDEPDNRSYLDSFGWVLFKRGKLNLALEQLQKAAHENPTLDATILDHLGDVYFQLKRYSDALQSWTRAQEFAAKATPPDKRLAGLDKKIAELRELIKGQSETEKSPTP